MSRVESSSTARLQRRARQLIPFVALFALCSSSWAADDLHAPWDRLLHAYVDDDGKVAYRDLRAADMQTLEAYLGALAAAEPSKWSREEQIAFWVNAYNAVIVRGVLAGQSAEGFIARKRLFSFYSLQVAGKTRTPDDIEHGILRPSFGEVRAHFALVCASSSCPKLRREAYRGSQLEEQLDDQTRRFLGDPTRNRFDGNPIRISSIFDWFGEDFERSAGTVLAFLKKYVRIEGTPDIEYMKYDWTMNAQPGQRPE